MSSVVTAVRRSLLVILVASSLGAAYAWWRDREQDSLAPAEWPPITPPEPTAEHSSSAVPEGAAPTSAALVNALVDAPEARSTDGAAAGWVASDDGSCPLSHPIKANDNSGIFHVPGGRFYDRTKAERCYSDDEAAVADGYRQAKN
jgi:hypothetical protein